MATGKAFMIKTIITSGVIVLQTNYDVDYVTQSIKIPVKAGDCETNVYMIIHTGNMNPSIKIDQMDDGVQIACYGMDTEQGMGNKYPLPITQLDEEYLYMNFWLMSLGNGTTCQLTYTFYQSPEVPAHARKQR